MHGLSNINLTSLPLTSSSEINRVITVHDLIPLIAPDMVSKALYLQFSAVFGRVLKRADRIVCVSNWTRNELLKRYPEFDQKTKVILNGRAEGKIDHGLRIKTSNDNQYKIMSVGRFEPYKRHEFLFEIVKNTVDLRLSLVTDAAGKKYVESNLGQLVKSGRIEVFVKKSPQEMIELYRSSDCYVQTSLYEGYCLPAAESMSHGTPVIYQSGAP